MGSEPSTEAEVLKLAQTPALRGRLLVKLLDEQQGKYGLSCLVCKHHWYDLCP